MSARPARTADGALREMLAAMNMLQLANAANAAGIPKSTLLAFIEGRTALSAPARQAIAHHVYAGRYFVKREEQRA
jgi:hypothetical protein